MNFSIRLTLDKDLFSIAHLDAMAFSEFDQKTHSIIPVPPRKIENLQSVLDLNPKGCFIAETSKPVGYIFSRIWGNLGWIGVFGVDPEYQKRGIVKALLTNAVDYLIRSQCKIIGLETRSDKIYNVGLYTCNGFQMNFPTLSLIKQTSHPPDPLPQSDLKKIGKERALELISEISKSVMPELDYASEAKNAIIHRWGEIFFYGDPDFPAFTIIRSIPKRESLSSPICDIAVLVVQSDFIDNFERILQSIEANAYAQDISQISISVNARNGDTLKRMLDYGFKIDSIALRMTLNRQLVNFLNGIDLSRWAM